MTIFSQSAQGEFRRQSLDEPFLVQVGDIPVIAGNQIVFMRDGVVAGTRTITGIAEQVSVASQIQESVNSVIYFWRKPVPGQSIVLIRITENATSGIITFYYSNGVSREFTNWADVGATLGVMDQESTLAENILAYKSFVNSPDGTNKTTMVDVNCAINFEAGTPIALIEP